MWNRIRDFFAAHQMPSARETITLVATITIVLGAALGLRSWVMAQSRTLDPNWQLPPVVWVSPNGTTIEGPDDRVHLTVVARSTPVKVSYTLTFDNIDRPEVYTSTDFYEVAGFGMWIASLPLNGTQYPPFEEGIVRAVVELENGSIFEVEALQISNFTQE